jgi:hypothetical protein
MPNETRLTDERKAFEEWFRKEHGWYEEPLALNTGEWNAYRAATRAALEQNAGAHQAAVETLLQLHEHTARLEAELAAARVDAERYGVLRMYVICSMVWPFETIKAPGGLLASSCSPDEWNSMTQAHLDKTLDDLLGRLPSVDKHVRADYQEWRASETRKRIDAARQAEAQGEKNG